MKSVLLSIKPYYVFLIIAHKMGWDILQEKTIEVRKGFPKDIEWNKVVHIYCSKDKKSFNLIPVQYQPLMGKFIGKVIGEFICDKITKYIAYSTDKGSKLCKKPFFYACLPLQEMCLTSKQIEDYGKGKPLYGWHISDLKIYDKPKELSEFGRKCDYASEIHCRDCLILGDWDSCCGVMCKPLTRPPQSYMFVEEV